ncbi:MAG: hypothetical protein U0270_00445 [Labilithrix sp.]
MTLRRSFAAVVLVAVAVISPDRAEAQGGAAAVRMQHVADRGSVVNNFTKIENLAWNAKPDQVLMVQSVGHQKNVGVFYDTTSSRWAVFNEDKSPMPVGAKFNVVADGAFVHRSAPANISQNWTYIDHPSANGNQLAVVFVTQRWSSSGANGGYNDRAVGVWFHGGSVGGPNKWAIYNEDRTAMGVGLEFNVKVFSAPSTAASPYVSTWATGPANPGSPTTLPPSVQRGGIFFMSHQYKNGGVGSTYYTAPWTVTPVGGGGAFQVTGGAAIPGDLAFNVVAY